MISSRKKSVKKYLHFRLYIVQLMLDQTLIFDSIFMVFDKLITVCMHSINSSIQYAILSFVINYK